MYSQTYTNNDLSTTTTFLVPANIHSYFNLSTMAMVTKTHPNCQNYLLLMAIKSMTDERCLQNPIFIL